LRHVIESITPASAAQAEAARARVAPAGAPMLERLASSLAGAQHSARLRIGKRTLVVVAGDHGAGDPGVSLGPSHPTIVAAQAIADGTAAVAQVARSGSSPIILVDAGTREPTHMPPVAVALGRGASRNLFDGPAMTVVDASLALDAGIALAVSLADRGLDVLSIGAIGVGAELASAALLGADLTAAGESAPPFDNADDVSNRALALGRHSGITSPLDRLAQFGGPDTAVLAGAILSAASMNIPIILDSYATGAAALVAAAFAPAVTGYLVAAHTGSLAHPRIVRRLGLEPVFEVGLGHGDGTGAALILPLLDQLAGFTNQA
jgi:nicotinate-nucleotide--dimethylbenzimidazole phosphoribosyltransferase